MVKSSARAHAGNQQYLTEHMQVMSSARWGVHVYVQYLNKYMQVMSSTRVHADILQFQHKYMQVTSM